MSFQYFTIAFGGYVLTLDLVFLVLRQHYQPQSASHCQTFILLSSGIEASICYIFLVLCRNQTLSLGSLTFQKTGLKSSGGAIK